MSSSRSRSEIETALSGKQQLHKRKISTGNSHGDFELESRSPRRQQVIGGDLTGISGQRRKNSLFNRLSDVHLANWIAVVVVLCILVAFFWPHNNAESIREVVEQNTQTQTEDFYTESRIDEPEQTKQTGLSFSRDSDLNRANDYREEEQLQLQIEELLIRAKQHISKNQYTSPENTNALNDYQEILKIDPQNIDAEEAISGMKERFLRIGREALSENKEPQASSALTTLSRIDTESFEYKQLSAEIQEWQKQSQITELLSSAKVAQDADNLILPAEKSSLYFYEQVLDLDADNDAAKQGIRNIADVYISRANSALIKGDLDAATGYLATASVVDQNHPSIGIVRDMITNAKPIAAQIQDRPQTTTQVEPQAQTPVLAPTPIQNNLPPLANTQNRQISDNRTPQQEANEQEEFDQIYLNQGLDAYYRGEYDSAAALLQPLADKGISRAQFRIGYMHYLGRGFPQNRTEADRVLRAALPAIQQFAEEGRSWAQSDLGSLYEDGLVLPRDYSEAVYWYRSSAEQGYAGAQTNLGIMYARGLGVSQSRQTAIEWFQRAAKQGDIAAQRNLQSLGVN